MALVKNICNDPKQKKLYDICTGGIHYAEPGKDCNDTYGDYGDPNHPDIVWGKYLNRSKKYKNNVKDRMEIVKKYKLEKKYKFKKPPEMEWIEERKWGCRRYNKGTEKYKIIKEVGTMSRSECINTVLRYFEKHITDTGIKDLQGRFYNLIEHRHDNAMIKLGEELIKTTYEHNNPPIFPLSSFFSTTSARNPPEEQFAKIEWNNTMEYRDLKLRECIIRLCERPDSFTEETAQDVWGNIPAVWETVTQHPSFIDHVKVLKQSFETLPLSALVSLSNTITYLIQECPRLLGEGLGALIMWSIVGTGHAKVFDLIREACRKLDDDPDMCNIRVFAYVLSGVVVEKSLIGS